MDMSNHLAGCIFHRSIIVPEKKCGGEPDSLIKKETGQLGAVPGRSQSQRSAASAVVDR